MIDSEKEELERLRERNQRSIDGLRRWRENNPDKYKEAVRRGGLITGGKTKIHDEYTDLPVSRQRKHQLRKNKEL